MSESPRRETVLPEGWLQDFFDKADLERSFAALAGCEHFHAETMRGLIRSIQVRLADARVHFRRALELSLGTPKTIANLLRQVVLNLFWFENRLLEGPLEGGEGVPALHFPVFPPEAVREYPEVKVAESLRLCAEGLLRLHTGAWSESAQIFQSLIERNRGRPEDAVAMYYLGLAASEHNLGHTGAALRNVENAGFSIQVGGATLNRARIAANLNAFYICLGDEEAACGWKEFLWRLECPEATKEVLLKRSGIVVERWASEARLLVV